MIAFLKGHPIEISDEAITLDVGGVGYAVNCSQNTLNAVQTHQEAELWIHTAVREDAITLFGFGTKGEKQLFHSLLKVDRVGPKMAIKVLSGAPPQKILGYIESGDVKSLSGLPRVGKKMAEQMVFKLKGKIKIDDIQASPVTEAKEQIVSALVNLGFKPVDAESVVDKLPTDITVEEGVRDSLAALSNH